MIKAPHFDVDADTRTTWKGAPVFHAGKAIDQMIFKTAGPLKENAGLKPKKKEVLKETKVLKVTSGGNPRQNFNVHVTGQK